MPETTAIASIRDYLPRHVRQALDDVGATDRDVWEDVVDVRAGRTADVLTKCLDGADDDTAATWRAYVDCLEVYVALGRPILRPIDRAEAPAQHLYARITGVKKRCRKETKTLDRGLYSDAETFTEAEIATYVDDVTQHAKDTHKSATVEVIKVCGVTSVCDGVRMFKAPLFADVSGDSRRVALVTV